MTIAHHLLGAGAAAAIVAAVLALWTGLILLMARGMDR